MPRSSRPEFSLVLGAALSVSACTLESLPGLDTDGDLSSSSGTSGGPTGDAPTTGASTPAGECDFAGAVQPIFTASCGCHAGAQPAEQLSLAVGAAHAALVGINSNQRPGVPRVAPGDPGGSYLMEKLAPTPSAGAQMPLGGALDAAETATISAWIAAGAPELEPFACDPQQPIGAVELDVDAPIQVQVGELVAIAAIVSDPEGQPLDATTTWASSAPLTLYADGQGVLLGVSPGTSQVTASAGGLTSAPLTVEVLEHAPPAATFTQVLALTDARCATSGCHVDGVEAGDLRFDRDADRIWEELVEDDSEQVPGLRRVLPNAPTQSYLIHKLVQPSPTIGGQMPLGAGPIASTEAQVIVRWILAGAPFD